MQSQRVSQFLKSFSLFLVLVGLTACANNKLTVHDPFDEAQSDEKITYKIVQIDRVSDQVLEVMSAELDKRLADAGQLGVSETATLEMEIRIADYTMRDGATRVMAGAMAGSDRIETFIIIKNRANDERLAEFTVESSNPTTTGSARTLIEAHVNKIADYVLHQRK